jgi:Raf kinase inhibitor-like YbhB/YbcL family protein
MATLKISSSAFAHNGSIPSKYTCDGADVSPPLAIESVPPEVKSLVLIVDDPDAPVGTWVHWVVWNISPATKEIKENSVPPGASQGMTDFRKQKYGGPCPPSGTHRYFFKLYALDSLLTLSSNSTKATVEGAMKGHILAQTELIGLYSRK